MPQQLSHHQISKAPPELDNVPSFSFYDFWKQRQHPKDYAEIHQLIRRHKHMDTDSLRNRRRNQTSHPRRLHTSRTRKRSMLLQETSVGAKGTDYIFRMMHSLKTSTSLPFQCLNRFQLTGKPQLK
jgi:hypothetical protein